MKFAYRHRRKIYAIALFTIALVVIACLPGTGYQVTDLDITPRAVISGGGVGSGVTINRLFNGCIQVKFNPVLYPLSFLMGNENVFRKFQGAAEFWDYDGDQIKEAVTMGTLLVELIRNLPYFVAAGLLATLLVMQLSKVAAIRRLTTRHKSQHTLPV